MPEPLLADLWTDPPAADDLELLRYRSNLLGADLRITNFAGGNTSSKMDLDGLRVLAVKGSGGDLGSITREGFALLDLDKLEALRSQYRGAAFEDEMADLYPRCVVGPPTAPPSIDTPLHAFLPFRHVDHLHPDWAIAIAAARNGREKLAEFNERFRRRVIWLPWMRPGFELGLQMRRAVEDNPGCDGILLANHGLFTWGGTHEECYRSSLRTVEDMGRSVLDYQTVCAPFGGLRDDVKPVDPVATMLRLRERIGPAIGHYDGSADAIQFANSVQAREVASLGTSCPDHFIRTRVTPLFLDGDVDECLEAYRAQYRAYYEAHREPGSPPMRSANPTVVVVPGAGLFTFARNKKEARITAEFYLNAIRVMRGATALGAGRADNYVALPHREAFRIEYWSLEEAKLRRMPAEGPLARKVIRMETDNREIARDLESKGAEVSRLSYRDTILTYGGVDAVVDALGNIKDTTYVQVLSRD
jgi:rhamnose utilization protein RhaD (predicted bifunctional aldolase and dehydrogenase)